MLEALAIEKEVNDNNNFQVFSVPSPSLMRHSRGRHRVQFMEDSSMYVKVPPGKVALTGALKVIKPLDRSFLTGNVGEKGNDVLASLINVQRTTPLNEPLPDKYWVPEGRQNDFEVNKAELLSFVIYFIFFLPMSVISVHCSIKTKEV